MQTLQRTKSPTGEIINQSEGSMIYSVIFDDVAWYSDVNVSEQIFCTTFYKLYDYCTLYDFTVMTFYTFDIEAVG